jgi:hypothetical protein
VIKGRETRKATMDAAMATPRSKERLFLLIKNRRMTPTKGVNVIMVSRFMNLCSFASVENT